jgi:hypothetical protein
MRRHQSDVHGATDGEAFVCPAKLQTFFRGTKLRYFEIVTAQIEETAEIEETGNLDVRDHNFDLGNGDEGESGDVQMPDTTAHVSRGQITVASRMPSRAINIDLDTLAYFHQYTSVTSLTLPTTQQEPYFWQTNVVQEALNHRWLICGLLGISACHLSISTAGTTSSGTHCAQVTRLATSFLEEREKSSLMSPFDATGLKKLVDRVECVLRLALWTLHDVAPPAGSSTTQVVPFSLKSCISTLRGLAITESRPVSQETVFTQAKSILDHDTPTFHDPSGAGHALFDRLRVLPSQLSSALGRPDNVQDVLATLSAIAALAVCCETSFASNKRWESMVEWLNMTTEHFHEMVEANRPVALVLIAYWAVLVKRAYSRGFWLLKGMAERIWRDVGDELQAGNGDVLGIVAGLVEGR